MKTPARSAVPNLRTLPRLIRNCFDGRSTATISASVGAFMLALPGAAVYAQTAPAAADTSDLAPIVVTGIRAGIEESINVKKDADTIVESLSAEDIGKLPDTTIAESLARLPGLTAQRDAKGNATNINIRGLGPDFNGYLLNGREQTSTGDSRGVDLSVYPAELISGATVYKTGDASLMAAGLAGTIDNHLIDPLLVGHRVLSAQDEKVKTGVGLPVSGTGKRYSLAYIDQFAGKTVGLALGYVHADGTTNSLANGSWGGNVTGTLVGGAPFGAPGDAISAPVSVPFAGGLGFESDRNTDRRNGFASILNYKPNKNFSTEVDFYHALINTALKKVKVNAGTNGTISNAVISNGVVQSGTFTMAPNAFIAYSENIFDDDTLNSLGWKTNFQIADTWSGSLDLNRNKATRIEKDIEAYGHVGVSDTLSFTNGGADVPSFTFGNPGLYTNPATIHIQNTAGWSGVNYPTGTGLPYAGTPVPQAGYMKGPTITDKIDGVRLDFRHDLGSGGTFSDLQFGLNYSKRSKERLTDEGLIIANDGTGGNSPIPYPSNAYVAGNVGGTGLNVLTFDPTVGLWPGAVLLRKYNNDILSKTWTVDEKVTTGYLKANLDSAWRAIPITGNLGAQIVSTNQSSAGFRSDATSAVTLSNPAGNLQTAGTTYTDFLPSLNLKGDLGRGNVLRFALAEQIARPTLTDMRNSMSAAVDTVTSDSTFNQFVGSSGNPNLKPFKAKAVDLSYEKYFGSKGYLSSAVFYKKLDTYITQSTNTAYDFTNLANSLGLAAPANGNYLGTFTTSVNGNGGNLAGYELTVSLPFSLATSYLEGFGVTASYSDTTSSVKLPNVIGLNPTQPVPAGGTITLPGLSKTNQKIMAYFERWGFSAFIAGNKRSEYIASVANTTTGGYPTLINIAPQSWVSMQIGYEVQQGWFKGLGFHFEGTNMNKPTYKEFKSDGSLNTENKTGATYDMRLSYKFE